MENNILELKHKLSSEESIHEMTKDKLYWLDKDKIKLLRQLSKRNRNIHIGTLNHAYRELEDDFKTLKKQFIENQRELKDKEIKFEIMDRGKENFDMLQNLKKQRI